MVLVLAVAPALAGYGDAVDGYPSAEERAVHMWIDAARASPGDFTADYGEGGCAYADFPPEERGFHTPFWWVRELAVTARAHAQDMDQNGFLGHTSSDGTTWEARLGAFYPQDAIGEAVAEDGLGTRHAVLSTWMCSPPHRAILLGAYDEMGVGVSGTYYTADLGRAGRTEWPLIPSAAQEPAQPVDEVTIRAVWFATAPTAIEAIVDGEPHRMELAAGSSGRGMYEVTLPTDEGCHTWWIRATFEGEHRWPEQGSYGWGDCEWVDPVAMWADTQVPATEPPPDEQDSYAVGCGCASVPTGGWVWSAWIAAGLPLWVRRRRA